SRYWRRLFSGRGSEALPLATMIEAARVIAAQFSRPAENGAHDLAIDLEFVHVADGRAGFDWLESRALPNVHLLGVVDLGSVVTIPPNANPLIVVDDGEGKSAIERAVIGVAGDYAGEGPAWPAYAVLGRSPSESLSLPRAWHQERVPIVGLSLAKNEGSDWVGPASHWAQAASRTAPIFGEHPAVGTTRDAIRELTDERLTGPVAIARVLVLALARLQECF
ncbi:MAG: hypothetical protein KDB53_15490, partial [Planctomycetes bacterium]|nr:hypothetical protein [Planctomycetota bacterium]